MGSFIKHCGALSGVPRLRDVNWKLEFTHKQKHLGAFRYLMKNLKLDINTKKKIIAVVSHMAP